MGTGERGRGEEGLIMGILKGRTGEVAIQSDRRYKVQVVAGHSMIARTRTKTTRNE
jgi:hypothetical protein